MGVNGVSGVNAASATTQVAVVQSNGTIEITFGGQKATVSIADSERFLETYNKVNYVAQRISTLEAKGTNIDSDEKNELTNLRQTLAKQRQYASFEVSPDGKSVVFKMKKDINAEEFKKLFYIEDGAFRDELKQEALHDGVLAGMDRTYSKEGEPYSGYDDAWMVGVTSFENGVELKENPDGGYYPDYTGATLSRFGSYTVAQGKVDPPKEGLFGWGFLGL